MQAAHPAPGRPAPSPQRRRGPCPPARPRHRRRAGGHGRRPRHRRDPLDPPDRARPAVLAQPTTRPRPMAGAQEDRLITGVTDDATHVSPMSRLKTWRARRDSNPRPSDPKSDALSAELRAPGAILAAVPAAAAPGAGCRGSVGAPRGGRAPPGWDPRPESDPCQRAGPVAGQRALIPAVRHGQHRAQRPASPEASGAAGSGACTRRRASAPAVSKQRPRRRGWQGRSRRDRLGGLGPARPRDRPGRT